MTDYMLEVCVDCVESAIAAQEGGAKRLELCASLIIGGTTPGVPLFKAVKKQVDIAINVLIRPRFGDFCYSPYEYDIILEEIKLFRDLGANGVVIGILNPDGNLDLDRMAGLVKAARGMDITLHRAFDVCRDPYKALADAADLGVHTILTSGQRNSALEGMELIAGLQQKALALDMEIMAGSGVNSHSIGMFLNATNVRAFHMSGKKTLDSQMQYRKEGVSMGLPGISEYEIWRTDKDEVAKASRLLQDFCR